MTIKAHFDGKSLIFDEPVQLPINEPLTLEIFPSDSSLTQRRDDQLAALAEMAQDADLLATSVDDSRDSIYSGTVNDTR